MALYLPVTHVSFTKLLKVLHPMEEAVYKELKALCQKVLDSGNDLAPSQYLQHLRGLEEKLILLDYLQYRGRTMAVHQSDKSSAKLDKELLNTLAQAEKQRTETPASTAQTPHKPLEPQEAPAPESIVPSKEVVPEFPHEETELQKRSLNESLSSGQISLGLNDRLAFTKYLFAGNQQDLNRVISQLNTFTSYRETEDFINDMVKPDYDWSAYEEYEERLIELVKARFRED